MLCLFISVTAYAADIDIQGRCRTVEFTSDNGTCTDLLCTLENNATLICGSLRIQAKRIFVHFDEKHTFSGARAVGQVTAIDGKTLLECDEMFLHADQTRATALQSTISIKKQNITLGTPIQNATRGDDEAILHGRVERLDQEHYQLFDGDITLCDCGTSKPSWRLNAGKIDMIPKKRATLWWPMLYISPFGLGPIPVTPPLLPLSLALSRRAPGFLFPNVSFFNAFPMIDIPFFIPLGNSWDVTIRPGMRFDWGGHAFDEGDAWQPKTWGAPRLGVRLRYAPSSKVEGELSLQWTGDFSHGAAKQRIMKAAFSQLVGQEKALRALRGRCEGSQQRCAADDKFCKEAKQHCDEYNAQEERVRLLKEKMPPPFSEEHEKDPSWNLVHRFYGMWKQYVEFSNTLSWQLDARWISDDAYIADFATSVQESVIYYIPSRTQLLWHPYGWVGRLGAEYFLSLNGQASQGPDVSNLQLGKDSGVHRGPIMALHLLPTEIIKQIAVEADVETVRTGYWLGFDTQANHVSHVSLSASWSKNIGFLAFHARSGLDLLTRLDADEQLFLNAASTHDLSVQTLLGKRWGQWLHLIRPSFRMRAIGWNYTNISNKILDDESVHYDARFDREPLMHIMGGVEQEWRPLKMNSWLQHAKFYLGLPYDILYRRIGQLHAEAALLGDYYSASCWSRVALTIPEDSLHFIQGLGSDLRIGSPYGGISMSYLRLSGGSDLLASGYYGLMTRPERYPSKTTSAQMMHQLVGSANIMWPGVLGFSYSTAYLPPIPGSKTGIAACGPSSLPDQPFRSSCFVSHQFSLNYFSRCNCWGLQASVMVPALAKQDYRIMVMFQVGQYSLGSQNTSRW